MTPNINLKTSDKIVAVLLGLIGLAIFGWVGYVVMPYLIAAATNTIIFLAELLVLILVPWTIFDNRHTILYKYKSLCRQARRKVVADDPIGTLSTVINRFEHKLEEIQNHLDSAVAAKKRQANQIKSWEKKRDEALAMAKVADHPLMQERQVTAAGRWDTAIHEAQPMLELLSKMHENMEMAKGVIVDRIEDMKNEREVLAARFDSMKSSQSAVKKFKKFFGTNPDLEMLQLSVDEIERQTTEAEAEIDGFLRNIAPIVEANSLEKKAQALAAMEKFGKYVGNGGTKAALPAGGTIEIVNIESVKEKVKR